MIFLIALGAFVTTFLGGLFAIKWSDKLHIVLGLSAGAMIGVAFFDLLPEAIELSTGRFDVSTISLVIALGFLVFMLLDRMIFHHCHEDGHDHHAGARGAFGAGSLSFHSFLDGIAVGLAFGISAPVGFIVAAAVLAHSFSDGISTVSMILRHGGEKKRAIKWLAVDALAPALGIISTFFFTLPQSATGLILALFFSPLR
jgi:zinc transporter ZupT